MPAVSGIALSKPCDRSTASKLTQSSNLLRLLADTERKEEMTIMMKTKMMMKMVMMIIIIKKQ
jgi:hypothetical protein